MKVKVKTWCKNTVDVKQQDRDGGASVKVGGGLQTSAGGASFYWWSGGILPQKILKSRGSEISFFRYYLRFLFLLVLPTNLILNWKKYHCRKKWGVWSLPAPPCSAIPVGKNVLLWRVLCLLHQGDKNSGCVHNCDDQSCLHQTSPQLTYRYMIFHIFICIVLCTSLASYACFQNEVAIYAEPKTYGPWGYSCVYPVQHWGRTRRENGELLDCTIVEKRMCECMCK